MLSILLFVHVKHVLWNKHAYLADLGLAHLPDELLENPTNNLKYEEINQKLRVDRMPEV